MQNILETEDTIFAPDASCIAFSYVPSIPSKFNLLRKATISKIRNIISSHMSFTGAHYFTVANPTRLRRSRYCFDTARTMHDLLIHHMVHTPERQWACILSAHLPLNVSADSHFMFNSRVTLILDKLSSRSDHHIYR